MILGIDISTSITGYCIIDAEGEIIRCDAWDMRNKNKFKTEFEKANKIRDELYQAKVQYPIERIFIEKPFTFFKSGGSTAKTMATLQRFNGIVSWIAYDVFDKEPEYLTAAQARKSLNIHIKRGTDTKKEIIAWLLTETPSFKVEYTSHGNPKPKYYDMADATIIAKAGLKTLTLPQE